MLLKQVRQKAGDNRIDSSTCWNMRSEPIQGTPEWLTYMLHNVQRSQRHRCALYDEAHLYSGRS
jgi:hypothetical protein